MRAKFIGFVFGYGNRFKLRSDAPFGIYNSAAAGFKDVLSQTQAKPGGLRRRGS